MNRRSIGIGLGIGALGLLGYGVSRLVARNLNGRRERTKDEKTAPEEAPEKDKDKRPEKIPCPGCGQPVREYEFFCPACGYSMDKKGSEEPPVKSQ